MKLLEIKKCIGGSRAHPWSLRWVVIGHTQVDDALFEYLSGFNWTLGGHGYPKASINKKRVLLHQVVFATVNPEQWPMPKSRQVDHIDRNKLNNQAINLRSVSRSVQTANRPVQSNNACGFKGVSWNKRRGKWIAQVGGTGKHSGYFGGFNTAEEAARRVNQVYRIHYPEIEMPNPSVGFEIIETREVSV